MKYLQGAPPYTHTKLHVQVLGSLHGGGLVCPLQSSLLAVLYTHHCGVGGVFSAMGQRVNFFTLCCFLQLLNFKQYNNTDFSAVNVILIGWDVFKESVAVV